MRQKFNLNDFSAYFGSDFCNPGFTASGARFRHTFDRAASQTSLNDSYTLSE